MDHSSVSEGTYEQLHKNDGEDGTVHIRSHSLTALIQ